MDGWQEGRQYVTGNGVGIMIAAQQETIVSATFDPLAIRSHVSHLHSLAVGIEGKLVVSIFNEGLAGTITQHKVGDIDGMVAAIMAHALTPGANVYTGLQVMRQDLPRGSRGGRNDIVAVLGLVADMDADTGKIGTMPIEASYVVETSPGNSQHVILLDKPMPPAKAEALAKALQKATGSDSGTGDITHVWRIPGSLNYPNAGKLARGRDPAPASVFFSEPFVGHVHDEASLTSALAAYITETPSSVTGERFTASVDTEPLFERLSEFGRSILESDGQPDRSRHAAKVIEQLHFEGFRLGEAVSLCLARTGTWTEKYKTDAAIIQDLERCWMKFIEPKEMEIQANAKAAMTFVNGNDNVKGATALQMMEKQQPALRAVTATPFQYRDPKTIPQRESLYAEHFNRRFLSMTLGIGGGGKSSLLIVDALAMVSGRALIGHKPERPFKVWYINLEDPKDEIERRFAAAAKHYGIDPQVMNQNLFVDSGRDQEFVVLRSVDKGKTSVVEPVVESIIQEMKVHSIDVLIIDPFISTHEVDENDNSKIQQVAAQFVKIANDANVSVELGSVPN